MFWNVRAMPLPTIRCGALAEERLAVELDLARVGLVEARDDVERGRLAGAVRPDQPGDVPLLHVERDAVEGDDASEAKRDVPDGEEGHRRETLNAPAEPLQWTRRSLRDL